MSVSAILARLRRDGLRVRSDGERLHLAPRYRVTPAVLALVQANKPALLRELAAPASAERLVVCESCRSFSARPSEQPDGWCARHQTQTWGRVPFECPEYEAAESAERERRRADVAQRLRIDLRLRVAFDVSAPLQAGPGESISVLLAVRHGEEVLVGELLIPREAWNLEQFVACLDPSAPGRPS